MISIASVIVNIVLQYAVTVTFLGVAFDIYHTPLLKASEGYRDYPTTVTVGNYTHDIGSAFLCEGEEHLDLTPFETLDEVTECFSKVAVVAEFGFTPRCTELELAELDWYYDHWYGFIVNGMVFYGFLLILIGAHEISVICKKKGCLSCEKEDPHDQEVTCHCVRTRQWIQFFLFWGICIFVVCIAVGCVIFTEHSAMSSSFISRFEVLNRQGAPSILPCDCGCVLQTETHVGWSFWFSMHLFMWYMLLYLNRIKISYKMGLRMLNQYMPVPFEMGEYGIDEPTFWRRVRVKKEEDPVKYTSGPKKGDVAYPQIEVNPTNQEDTIECYDCCETGWCLSLKDKTLTVLSYRTFYALLVMVVFVVLFDASTFFFQIVLRSHPANATYEWFRVLVHAGLAIWCGLSGTYTIGALRMLKPSKNKTSVFIIGSILNGLFHAFAHFANVFVTEYFGHIWSWVWKFFWILIGLFEFSSWMMCFFCWDYWKNKICCLPERWTLKLFERDSMGQNLQYLLTCGAPAWGYPKWCKKMMDWKLGPVEFQLANRKTSTETPDAIELGTQTSTHDAKRKPSSSYHEFE